MSIIRTQKDAFLDYEGDGYFHRNENVAYSPEDDVVLHILKEYSHRPENVLEIGCSTGYRLDAINQEFGARVSGIEPSTEAITKGQSLYPNVNFLRGTADEMQHYPSGSFDLVIIGFVLYVIDRDILFKVIAETDRVLADGGILMIIDFFSEKPTRNPYQHIKDIQAYAFKQNYEEIFLASKLYQLMDKRSMSHTTKSADMSGDYYNKFTFSTLRKDLAAGYR